MQNLLFFPEIADKSSSLFIGNGAFRRTTIQAHDKKKLTSSVLKQTLLGKNYGCFPPRPFRPNSKSFHPNSKSFRPDQKLVHSKFFLYVLESNKRLTWTKH